MIKNIFFPENKTIFEKLLFFFFSIYPIAFLVGNFAINLIVSIIFIIFFCSTLFKKVDLFKSNKFLIYLLLFLFISLLVNLYFSNNFYLSYPRVFKFILVIFFVLAFKQLLKSYNYDEINKLYKIWSIVFLIVIIDLIFELVFKSNILGFKSIIPGRLTSFTGKEMIIGHFFSAFALIILSYIYLNFKNKNLSLLVALSFIILSFLIGERSNFIKTFIILSIFIFFTYETKLKFKLFFISLIVLLFISLLNFNNNYKVRYFNQLDKLFSKNGINNYLENSIYGAHYKVAQEIFKDNPLFGVGIKNFRVESFSKKYDNLEHKERNKRGNTHPHQIHYELLSETGLFGYLSFMTFIFFSLYFFYKSFKKHKNIYQFSGMLFVVVNLLPLLPSGSFFSTYSAGLFWINYSIMMGYIGNEN